MVLRDGTEVSIDDSAAPIRDSRGELAGVVLIFRDITRKRREEERNAFLADEKKYLDQYPLTAEQRRCVLERDWIGMLRVGANIYHLSKLGATDGRWSLESLFSSETGTAAPQVPSTACSLT